MALTKWTYYRTEGTTKEDDATITIPANVGEYLRCDTQQSDLMSVYFTGNIGTPRADDRFIGGFVEETDEGQIVLGILLTAGNAVVLYSKKAGQVQYLQHTDITVTSGSYSIYLKKTDGGVSVGFGYGSVDAEKNILTIQDALWPSTAHWIIGNYPISDYPFSWELKGTFKSVVDSQAIRESKEGNLLVWNGLGETQINTQVIPSGSLLPKETTLIPGSVTVDKGYYNADGTNIIKFTNTITKTLTEAQENLSYENKILLTLDNQNSSSFVLTGTDTADPTEYVVTKELTTAPKVYVDPSKQYILGTEPTGINASVKSQGVTYELKYLTLNGSVSYDETTGKLSGFSTSNYATSSSGITFGSSFDLIFNVTVASASTQQTLFYGKGDAGLLFTDGKIAAWFGSNIHGVTSVVNGNTYWIRLVWGGTSYTCYSLLDDETYTLATLPELSSWTQEFTYSSSSNIFSTGYWIGYHSQASDQYARSTFNMGKAQMTTNGVTYRYANGDAEAGSVSFTQGWLYNQTQNRTYQNKDTAPVSVEQLKENNAEGAAIGYKNSLGLKFDQTSDVSLPIIASTFGGVYNYNFNQDIYLDNTKTKILGTVATSESWETTPYTITPGTGATDIGSITYTAGYKYIDETNGSFFIRTNTTKTLDELVVGDKAEQMGLYLVIKTDLTTDFVLSSTTPTTDISYAEKVVDVYLDATLSYIYGTTPPPTNFIMHGEVEVHNGIASNFSADNYITEA